MQKLIRRVVQETMRVIAMKYKGKKPNNSHYTELLLDELQRIMREQVAQSDTIPNDDVEEAIEDQEMIEDDETDFQTIMDLCVDNKEQDKLIDEGIAELANQGTTEEDPESNQDELIDEVIEDPASNQELVDFQPLMTLSLDNEEQDELIVDIPYDNVLL